MRLGPRHTWIALGLLIPIVPGISRAADIGWPEAVGRLAGERSKAEACAASLKAYTSNRFLGVNWLTERRRRVSTRSLLGWSRPSPKAGTRKAFPVSKPIWNMAHPVL